MSSIWKDKYITSNKITASWYTKLNRRDSLLSVDFMNFAFYTHDQALASINACTDSGQKAKMLKKFKECQEAGCCFGVNDMNEAMVHLRTGTWSSTNTGRYWYTAGKPKLYPNGHGFETAEACDNFVRAVEDRLAELKSLTAEYSKLAKKAEQENNKASKDWAAIGKLLGDVKSNAERAEPFLWASPKVQSRVVVIKNYSDYLGKLHTAATRVVNLKSLGLETHEAVGLATAATVLDYVPIMGPVYGAAVDWIIGFLPAWKQFMANYHLRLKIASEGGDYTKIRVGN